MVAHTCNLSTHEAIGSCVQGQPRLHSKFNGSLNYILGS